MLKNGLLKAAANKRPLHGKKFINVHAKKYVISLAKPQKLLDRHYFVLKSKEYSSELLFKYIAHSWWLTIENFKITKH